MPDLHEHDEIQPGETCPDCGTHFKIMDELPKRPLTESEIASLADGDSFHLAEAITLMKSMVMPKVPEGTWATEDIVLATDEAARVLSYYEEHGWVVDVEEPLNCDCCTPQEHGENVLFDFSKMLKQSMGDVSAVGPDFDDEQVIRWPAEELGI